MSLPDPETPYDKCASDTDESTCYRSSRDGTPTSRDEVDPLDFYCLARHRPRLRGVIHEVVYMTSPMWCVYALHCCRTWEAALSLALSLAAFVFLFRSCSKYHRTLWKEIKAEEQAMHIDFLAISTMIAYSFAPAQAMLLEHGVWIIALSSVLAVASVGASCLDTTRFVRTGIYLAQGVVALGMLLAMSLTSFEARCVLITATSYGVGAAGYAFQKPVLWRDVFGFHELWHLLIAVAAASTYMANVSIVQRVQVGTPLPFA